MTKMLTVKNTTAKGLKAAIAEAQDHYFNEVRILIGKSHGYRYWLLGGRVRYRANSAIAWEIDAGCRTWYSLKDMRHHYHRPTWRDGCVGEYGNGWTDKEREKYRKQSLALADRAEAFMAKHGIKLKNETRPPRIQRKNKKARVAKVPRQRKAAVRGRRKPRR